MRRIAIVLIALVSCHTKSREGTVVPEKPYPVGTLLTGNAAMGDWTTDAP